MSEERKFRVGDKVRIKGDKEDYTDHLDGMTGTVVGVNEDDCFVTVGNKPFPYIIWNYNMELVEHCKRVEHTFITTVQLTSIVDALNIDEVSDAETIGKNIEGYLKEVTEAFDDIKVTNVQVFEREITNED